MNSTTRTFIQLGSIMMMLSVALGAFGAHGLKSVLDADMFKVYNTAVEYQFYHSIGLFIIAFLSHVNENSLVKNAGYIMFGSMIIFSGSLYLMTVTGIKWLGAITPIGGTGFIISWFMVMLSVRSRKI